MAMDPSDFVVAYPEFSDVDFTTIEAKLNEFDLLYQGDYGDLSDYLSGLYAAHQLTVFTMNTGTGPNQVVKSRSVDGLSWSYSDSGSESKAGVYASTKYGQQFYSLIAQFGYGPIMAKAVP